MDVTDIPKHALVAQCKPCGNRFTFAMAPLLVNHFAETVRRTKCPRCGAASDRMTLVADADAKP